jgi:hypothetical protein
MRPAVHHNVRPQTCLIRLVKGEPLSKGVMWTLLPRYMEVLCSLAFFH